MNYALFSDAHGNLEALTAVVERMKASEPDHYLFMGDVVGYGANPSECLELITELKPTWVAGNHDYAACGKLDPAWFNEHARAAIQWTQNVLTHEEKEQLAKMPLVAEEELWTLVHGGLNEPEFFPYVQDEEDAQSSFSKLKTHLLALGHSHIPMCYEAKGKSGPVSHTGTQIKLNPKSRYLINPGSVGQPRDGVAPASFALFDSEASLLTYHRVNYDIEAAARKIIKAGLPTLLAERLKTGW